MFAVLVTVPTHLLPGHASARQNRANLAQHRPDCDVACPEGCGLVRIVAVHEARGFTGAAISFTDLSCGHQEANLDDDDIDYVR